MHGVAVDGTHTDITLAAFAADLRALRVAAGSPTLVALAGDTGISKSVVGEAFAGRRLPTERTVRLVVATLGGDEDAWVERRLRVCARSDTETAEIPAADTAEPERPRLRASTLAWIVVAVVVGSILGSLLTLLLSSLLSSGLGARSAAASPASDLTGTAIDPAQTSCWEDAEPVAQTRMSEADAELVLFRSASCNTAWAALSRADALGPGGYLHVGISARADELPMQIHTRTGAEIAEVRTGMIFLDEEDRLRTCAWGIVSLDGRPSARSPELCL